MPLHSQREKEISVSFQSKQIMSVLINFLFGSRRKKTTTIRRTAVREARVCPLKPLEHHSTMVSRGLRGPFIGPHYAERRNKIWTVDLILPSPGSGSFEKKLSQFTMTAMTRLNVSFNTEQNNRYKYWTEKWIYVSCQIGLCPRKRNAYIFFRQKSSSNFLSKNLPET